MIKIVVLLAGCMFGQLARGFLVSTTNMFARSTRRMAFEIEQKFALTAVDDLSALKDRLHKAGLEPAATTEMVDWYFDDISQYTLIKQDCWLRYRDRKDHDGQWELKRGQKHGAHKATVYQEIEGLEGVEIACNLLSKSTTAGKRSSTKYDFEGQAIPELPPVENADLLQPFAQIVTFRSSWKGKDGLVVDLDATDFGYTVGEVEAVVEKEDEIEPAKEAVRSLIADITGDVGTSIAQGKLEYYLEKNRPQVYDMLVNCGIMKK